MLPTIFNKEFRALKKDFFPPSLPHATTHRMRPARQPTTTGAAADDNRRGSRPLVERLTNR
jgi:hypothetical protein